MARRFIVTLLCMTFFGCESDFDRCLATEYPRASDSLEITELKALADQVAKAAKRLPTLFSIEEELLTLEDDISQRLPQGEEAPGYWDRPDVHALILEYDAKVAAIYESRGFTYEPAGEPGIWDQPLPWLDEIEETGRKLAPLLDARAAENNWWGKVPGGTAFVDPTARAVDAEWASSEANPNQQLDPLQILSRALKEILGDLRARVLEHEATALELATRTCNGNGLYE